MGLGIEFTELGRLNRSEKMKNNVEKSYGVALSENQLKFLVNCIDIAQETHSINPDKEESDIIRRLGRKHDELQDQEYQDNIYYELQ